MLHSMMNTSIVGLSKGCMARLISESWVLVDAAIQHRINVLQGVHGVTSGKGPQCEGRSPQGCET